VPKILHVDVLAEPRIEQHIPSRMDVIVIYLNVVAVPTPVLAVIDIVRRDDPCGMVIEYHPPSAVIHRHEHKFSSVALETPMGIVTACLDAIAVIIPVAVLIAVLVVMFVPAEMAAAVMVFVFFVSVVLVLALSRVRWAWARCRFLASATSADSARCRASCPQGSPHTAE
jgi:hypothetical protein